MILVEAFYLQGLGTRPPLQERLDSFVVPVSVNVPLPYVRRARTPASPVPRALRAWSSTMMAASRTSGHADWCCADATARGIFGWSGHPTDRETSAAARASGTPECLARCASLIPDGVGPLKQGGPAALAGRVLHRRVVVLHSFDQAIDYLWVAATPAIAPRMASLAM